VPSRLSQYVQPPNSGHKYQISENVRCLICSYWRHSCCQCLGACTFIHDHSFSNSSLVKLTMNEWIKYNKCAVFLCTAVCKMWQQWPNDGNFCKVFVRHDCLRLSTIFPLAVCACLICLYIGRCVYSHCVLKIVPIMHQNTSFTNKKIQKFSEEGAQPLPRSLPSGEGRPLPIPHLSSAPTTTRSWLRHWMQYWWGCEINSNADKLICSPISCTSDCWTALSKFCFLQLSSANWR